MQKKLRIFVKKPNVEVEAIKFILTYKPYFCDNCKILAFQMKKKSKIDKYTDQEALDYHNSGKSGKIEILYSKLLLHEQDQQKRETAEERKSPK